MLYHKVILRKFFKYLLFVLWYVYVKKFGIIGNFQYDIKTHKKFFLHLDFEFPCIEYEI